jgi:hypothetical protein
MTLIQDNPQQEPLFTLAPPPASPKPERNKLRPWHIAVLIVGIPIIAFLSCVGANAVAHWFIGDTPAAHAETTATHKPKPHNSNPAAPRYNLPGYRSAISGPVEKAFASALWAVRSDIKRPDYSAASTDAPRLIAAANSWLSLLKPANPPPTYGPQKLTYIQAATLAGKAGETTQQALNAGDLTQLQRGADQAKRAQWLLSHATAQGPHGELTPMCDQRQLASLRYHWQGAYRITCYRGVWLAIRNDTHESLTAESADELLRLIRADYRRKPVPRDS